MNIDQEWSTQFRWTGRHKKLLMASTPSSPSEADEHPNLDDFCKRSSEFPVAFPIDSVRCSQLKHNKAVSPKVLEANIESAYPIVHERALHLYASFLLNRRTKGTKLERQLYKTMSLVDLVDRLLKKRAVTFVGPWDRYELLGGKTGASGWEEIGTDHQKAPLLLSDCLSYDEVKLGALLSVSSHTRFLNDGNRYNKGIYEEDPDRIEDNGVIVGLIGARLHKSGVMEHTEVVKSAPQKAAKGLFSTFYGDHDGKEVNGKPRYVEMPGGTYFDVHMYARRIAISIDTLLVEAEHRARVRGQMAYVHVVGLGLGVWKICEEQDRIYMETFEERLQLLGPHLKHVSDVRFAHIRHKSMGKYDHNAIVPIEGHPLGGIRVLIANDEPHLKLKGEDQGKLLVVSYAWDGNALPGNEFWQGSLWTSGDPAAASSTQVAELHNPHINERYVCGGNLRVATLDKGVLTLSEFQEVHRSQEEGEEEEGEEEEEDEESEDERVSNPPESKGFFSSLFLYLKSKLSN